jgi:hypothetical protein
MLFALGGGGRGSVAAVEWGHESEDSIGKHVKGHYKKCEDFRREK